MTEPLARSIAVGFVWNAAGRMLHMNAPDKLPPPRMLLAGCAAGNRVVFRHDVDDDLAHRIEELAADEPPLSHPDLAPRHLDEYLSLLAPVTVDHGLEWLLPHDVVSTSRMVASTGGIVPSTGVVASADGRIASADDDIAGPGVDIVASGTPAGDRLLADLAREMPPALVAHGFVDHAELWPPWCAAIVDGVIASLAFAARIDAHAAAAGVFTLPAFRGRRLAPAVTAAWAAHPALRDRAVFYGTDTDNVASQRVAARLGLPFFGRSLLLT